MKLLFLLVFGTVVFASDIKGIVEAIDDSNKTITVNGDIIYVLPYTEIEKDSCNSGWDIPQRFTDLRVNDAVKVEVFYDHSKIMAKEIEIICLESY